MLEEKENFMTGKKHFFFFSRAEGTERFPESSLQGSGISTTKLIAGSFLAAILFGTFLLMLPVSSADGNGTPFVDAAFTATTSVCVTGLVTVVTAVHWSTFGKVVILLLAQLGGLGVITVLTMLMILLGRRITLKERMLISEMYNLSALKGMVLFVRRIVKGTLLVEGIGFLLCIPVFVRDYGWKKGMFGALFHAVSSFCNAGMDILGTNSLIPYAHNPLVMAVTSGLIVLGGLGFPVWWDILDGYKKIRSRKLSSGQWFGQLQLHTRVVLVMTAVLIVIPAALFFLMEYHNPQTMGAFSLFDKIQASLFQSITTRTAGFAALDQGKLTSASSLLTIILMFIGGSPAGTAGGMKTTTIAILVCTVWCMAHGQSSTVVFNRKVADESVRSALCVVVLGVTVMLLASLCLMAVEDYSFLDILYEVVSALGTVGLSRGITSDLTTFSKWILIGTMYIGRIGPITMVVAMLRKGKGRRIRYELPKGRIIVG